MLTNQWNRGWRRCAISLAIGNGLAIASLAIIGASSPTLAADKVVFRYQSVRESIAIADLANFAATGQLSPQLALYLAVSRANPETVKQALNREVDMTSPALEQLLNSWIGKLVVDEISQVVQNTSHGNKKAIREAIVQSVQGDGKFSLIEVLQNYPAPEIEVNIDRLIEINTRINQEN